MSTKPYLLYIRDTHFFEGDFIWKHFPLINKVDILRNFFSKKDPRDFLQLKKENRFMMAEINGFKYHIKIAPLISNYAVTPNTYHSTVNDMGKTVINHNATKDILLKYIEEISNRRRAIEDVKSWSSTKENLQTNTGVKIRSYTRVPRIRMKVLTTKSGSNLGYIKGLYTIQSSYSTHAEDWEKFIVTYEFSPYIEDENKVLDEFKDYLMNKRHFISRWHMHPSNFKKTMESKSISHYIDVLKQTVPDNDNKLDQLARYIKKYAKSFDRKLIYRDIYKYNTVLKSTHTQDGLYVVRLNGRVTNYIYCCLFKNEKILGVKKTGYVSLTKLADGDFNHLYMYYTDSSEEPKLYKVKARYFIVYEDGSWEFKTEHEGLNKLTNLQKIKYKHYQPIRRFLFVRKKKYLFEKVVYNTTNPSQNIRGSVRVKGEFIITLRTFTPHK